MTIKNQQEKAIINYYPMVHVLYVLDSLKQRLPSENNQAMQRQLFQGGSFETQNLENRDMDVTLLILSKKKIKKEEICSSLSIPKDIVENIVKKLADKGKVNVESDNETVVAIDIVAPNIDSSTNSVGEVSRV